MDYRIVYRYIPSLFLRIYYESSAACIFGLCIEIRFHSD